ncbi:MULTISPECIES: hypothetical protein [Streptomyces]|uniref:Uncharacterized protein n=1 Tax=Streptomyces venezuelae (strain ATCC 10712 / CBS 650.69 / DSM 40230 / JCM 4526 / NBRC 13096 / PD 04745) TaxID=953739 RepID=F2RDL8_STRVP|nr:hypothetical protein [Streptomyces venezuelae]APE24976.1 hypothetical protein vnz_30715 [Streptomyces venezuelae]QES02320.1 hypothetical protein DEJ43_31210 [Streptomyces venezuelae ATCC 10712]CCA59510.1 hypothetical protein SVEN_6224 [Streptomyces venezuelae ATCC 10712]
MTIAVAPPARRPEPTVAGAPRSAVRHLVIEDLDALPEQQGAAMLSICIVSVPVDGPTAPAPAA